MNCFKYYLYKHMFCVHKRNVSRDVYLTHTKHILIGEKTDNNHFGVGGGLYILILPYNSNFRYFEIKSLVPRTSFFQDSNVILKK